MRVKTKLQHYKTSGCILNLLTLLTKIKAIKSKSYYLPTDGFLEAYDSDEERELSIW